MTTELETLQNDAETARLRRQIAEDTAVADSLTRPSELPGEVVWEALEKAAMQEARGDYVGNQGWRNDDPTFQAGLGQTDTQPGDRAGGRMRPIVETDADLDRIRGIGRIIAATSPSAIAALLNLKNYVMGTGFDYEAEPRTDYVTKEFPKLVATVQTILDEFDEDNDWIGDFEREWFERGIRDGDVLPALYHDGGGHCQVRMIEPEMIRTPIEAAPEGRSYTFGVDTRFIDVCDVAGYWIDWDGTGQPDCMPAGQLLHTKRNVDRNVKRGISDFYPVYEYLQDVHKLVRNTAKGAGVAAAIAWIEEFAPGTTQSQVEDLRSNAATMRRNETDMQGRLRQKYSQHYDPATILRTEAGRIYKPGPLAQSNAPNFVVIEQAVLRVVGSRWAMPEYMISGDASNANYSSTLVSESPFIKNCETEQGTCVKAFRKLLWRVIEIALHAGRFSRFGFVDVSGIKRLVQLAIEPPKAAATNAKEEHEILSGQNEKGVISTETWQQQVGLDPDVERKRGAKPLLPGPMFTESAAVRHRRLSHELWEGYG